MPVKLLNSAVLKWPDPEEVIKEAKQWAIKYSKTDKNIIRIICFGSIAKNTWGLGSDLDILIEVESSDVPFYSRSLCYYPDKISVPVEILVYTSDELRILRNEGRRFIREIKQHHLLLYEKHA